MAGLPVERWRQEDAERVYWAMGTRLGTGMSQSVLGDRLGHVRDVTREDPPRARLPQPPGTGPAYGPRACRRPVQPARGEEGRRVAPHQRARRAQPAARREAGLSGTALRRLLHAPARRGGARRGPGHALEGPGLFVHRRQGQLPLGQDLCGDGPGGERRTAWRVRGRGRRGVPGGREQRRAAVAVHARARARSSGSTISPICTPARPSRTGRSRPGAATCSGSG